MSQILKKILIVSGLVFFGTTICIAVALVAYYYSIPNCNDTTASNSNLPIYPLLLEIGKFDVTITGKRQLKIGQTFIVEGDGRWFSNTTLIAINNEEAIFLLEYYDYENERVDQCIWHAPKTDFNN